MSATPTQPVYAFAGDLLLAHGPLGEALPVVHAAAQGGLGVLVFDAATGKVIDLDLRGTVDEALARLAPTPEDEPGKRGPGRPKLGVTPREVTLLPRHWDWLSSQPGGASVALRKLVETALRETEGPTLARRARDATYAFMTAIAGDRPGYEEATRVLFAGDWTAFDAAIEGWPADVRQAVSEMAEPGWRNGLGRPR